MDFRTWGIYFASSDDLLQKMRYSYPGRWERGAKVKLGDLAEYYFQKEPQRLKSGEYAWKI
jgi:hypothetical protein